MAGVTLVILAVAISVASVACGQEPTPTSVSGVTQDPGATQPATRREPLKVVSTVSPITSIVENVGGTRVRLEGIVPEGINSHTFEPRPSVARMLAEADLIVLNGLFLEEPTLDMAKSNKRAGAVILSLGDRATTKDNWQFDFSFPESKGQPNPHLWPDPFLALRYAELVRDELVRLDPSNADYYNRNLEAFRDRIIELDKRITAAVQTVPAENRKLLTYHDSWTYFAMRYGLTVIGAVQPSGFSEPSAREVGRLIDQIKQLKLPAVFGSEVFSSDVPGADRQRGGRAIY